MVIHRRTRAISTKLPIAVEFARAPDRSCIIDLRHKRFDEVGVGFKVPVDLCIRVGGQEFHLLLSDGVAIEHRSDLFVS